ncbi:MAG: ABC-2 family transporter protein [Ktedonobacteraceae bacterium]
MNYLLAFYLQSMKTGMLDFFQYRVGQYFYMIGMMAEPVIYLVVWSTVANAQGGSVAGYTAGSFAAYYIVWTLVRNINIVFTPYGWEGRIQRGELSAMLLRPLHPIHYDLAFFAGTKVAVILFWLPIAALLTLLFHPVFQVTPLGGIVFFFALWGAYLIRSMLLWLLGMITFWTTRVGAIYDLYFAFELLLSGRLVPLALMPPWVRQIAAFLPFQWTFGFPIEALIGQLSPQQLLLGLGIQVLWIAGTAFLVRLMWRSGVRRFASVGN